MTIEVPDGASLLFDTNPIIYLLEGHSLGAQFRPLFEAVDSGRLQALVTPITVAEIVSGPLKAGNAALAERYRRTLTDNAGWTVRDLDADVAMLAARLRIQHRLKLPDAFQLAVAISENCFALVTHDRDFASVRELPILGCT